MSKYSIIQIGSTQYNVEEGKEYSVDKFEAEVGKDLEVTQVLAVGNADEFIVGNPFIDKATVTLEILDQAKGEKVVSRVYKAKSRYRRTKGFRKLVTNFRVKSIKY
jgi:large subunit ribosomal protein L21